MEWYTGYPVTNRQVRFELEHLQRPAFIMITGAMKITPTKVLEMLLDLPILGMAVESTAQMAEYCLPRLDPRNLGIGHKRIWAKADKMDGKFSTIKDHVTLRRTFGKYCIAIPTKKEWVKN